MPTIGEVKLSGPLFEGGKIATPVKSRLANCGPLRNAMILSTALVERAARAKAPANFGLLQKSLASTVSPDGMEGKVGSPLIYADVMERGRRPGQTPPPIAPILLWVKRKQIQIDDAARLKAFVFAVIAKRRMAGKKPPPVEALVKWAIGRNLRAKVAATRASIARAIQISIGRKGIQGRHYFRDAINESRDRVIQLLKEGVAACIRQGEV